MPQKFVIPDDNEYISDDDVPLLPSLLKKNEGFVSKTVKKVKKKADDFIISHLDELAQKKPGILNPNPEENPLIGKSLLPKTAQEPGPIGAARHWAYENLVRSVVSPVGILGSVLGAAPGDEPIPNPKKLFGNIEEPKPSAVDAPGSVASPEVALSTKPRSRAGTVEQPVSNSTAKPIVKGELPEKPRVYPAKKRKITETNVVPEPIPEVIDSNVSPLTNKSDTISITRKGQTFVSPGTQEEYHFLQNLKNWTEGKKPYAEEMNIHDPKNKWLLERFFGPESEIPEFGVSSKAGLKGNTNLASEVNKAFKTKELEGGPVGKPGETGAAGPGADLLIRRRRMGEGIKELDAEKAPDIEYRVFLEDNGLSHPLEPGETWRNRGVRFYKGEDVSAKAPVIEAPTQTEAPTPKPETTPERWQNWRNQLDELDRTHAPDEAYRDILSTGARDTLRKGQTWRNQVLKYIEKDKTRLGVKDEAAPQGEALPDIEPLRSKDVLGLKPSTLPDVFEPSATKLGDITPPSTAEAAKAVNRYDRRGHITGRFLKKDIPIEPDMFDRGALDAKAEPTHQNFLQSLKDTFKQRTGKLWNDEDGALWLPNVNPFGGKSNVTLKNAIQEWGWARNASDLLQSQTAKSRNNSAANTKLLAYLDSIGIKAKNKNLNSPKLWNDIKRIDSTSASMMENYFGKATPKLHEVANVFRGTKNLALTGGVPYRTGQISAHGFNIGRSDLMASGFVKGTKKYLQGSVDPKVDIDFVKQHPKELDKLVRAGMSWSDIEGQSALGPIETKIDQIPYIGKVNKWRREAFEHPLFQVHLPAVKLELGMTKAKNLIAKGVPEAQAWKQAATWANDFSGSVDSTFRNKTIGDLANIGLLAPHWTESRLQVARKGLLPKSMGGVEGYGAPAARGAALAAPGTVARIAAVGGLANYLSNSKPSESTTLPAGETSLKKRGLDLLGTAVEPQRALIQALTQESQGNVDFPFEYVGNKLSMPTQAAINLLRNIDPFENRLSGKDRFGRKIPTSSAWANIGQELTRPVSMSFIQSAIDAARGKATPEEALAKALELPLTYTFKSKPKGSRRSSGLRGLR